MDLFGEVLLSIKIEANSIGVFSLGTEFGFSMPATPPVYAFVFSCIDRPFWVMPAQGKAYCLAPGDSVLLLHGGAFTVASAPDAASVKLPEYFQLHGLPYLKPSSRWTAPVNLRLGEGAMDGRLLSSAFVLRDSAHNPLLSALPPAIVLPGSARDLFPWMPSLLHFLATGHTSTTPGYVTTATHLADLLFSCFIRAYSLSLPGGTAGWIRGIADRRISKALISIHTQPGQAWNATTLAQASDMSRSAFVRRFCKLVGQSPTDYLIAWRMQVAAEQLIQGKKSVAVIAEGLGYQSERAFREAFKRRFGMPPLRYAKSQTEEK